MDNDVSMSGILEAIADIEASDDDDVVGHINVRRTQDNIFNNFVQSQCRNGHFEHRHSSRIDNAIDHKDLTIKDLMKRNENAGLIDNARDYQLELFELAKQGNIIAVLDTGTGKTLIAVLLIRWMVEQEAHIRELGNPSRVAMFLVPSVNLVLQQTAVLECNTHCRVSSFCGAMGVDLWSKEDWSKILAQSDVIVCTADILLNNLSRGFISISQISLIVLDEAHHAKKDHAYARIILDHYLLEMDLSKRPKIFGMTASPVDAKQNVADAASRLEMLLHSRIVTTGSMSSLQTLRRPEETNVFYASSHSPWNSVLANDVGPQMARLRHLHSHYKQSQTIASHLGSWCADQYMLDVLSPRAKWDLEGMINKDYRTKPGLLNTQQQDQLRSEYEALLTYMSTTYQTVEPPTSNLWTDKVSVLKRILDEAFTRPSDDRCMVFVEQKATARMLQRLFNELDNPFLKCGYLIGNNSSSFDEQKLTFKGQVLTLTKFREGEINCLFVTSVAEEGLDIPLCNLVIRFDLYKTMIQYVQSRGRARQNQSRFIHMLNRNDSKQQEIRQAVQIHELSMRRWCEVLPEDRKLFDEASSSQELTAGEADRERFDEPTTGAMLSYTNALNYLAYFSAMLPSTTNQPQHYTTIISPYGNKFVAEINLPPGAPIRVTKGPPQPRKDLAKRSAAFKMCRILYDLNLLDNHFLPIYADKLPAMRNAHLAVNNDTNKYAMLTKPSAWMHGIGTIPNELYVVIVDFSVGFEQEHRQFAMLTRVSMPEFPVFPLFRNDGRQTTVISHTFSRPIDVTIEEVECFASFTFRILKDVFSKTYSHTPEQLAYFLAPIQYGLTMSSITTKEAFDWELMQTIIRVDYEQWNSSTSHDMLLDRFFVAFGDGSRKLISKAISDTLRPSDPVPEDAVKYKWSSSILDYSVSLFKNARAKAIWMEDQPVLVAEQLNANRRNMLAPAVGTEVQLTKKAYICPEPFRISILPPSIAVTALAWPSVIWRFESILIALEACAYIGISCNPSYALAAITKDSRDHDGEISCVHHGMGENYERLEFLGDCFLKMATTIAVFIHRQDADEEASHVDRMLLLCNRTLYETSVNLELYKYIRSQPLSRRLWYPPGLQLLEGRGAKDNDNSIYYTQTASLSKKTIADVSEALIGAAFLSHDSPGHWHPEHWKDAVIAVTRLVGAKQHHAFSWYDYINAYNIPEYQTRSSTASQREVAAMIEQSHDYHFQSPTLLRSAFIHASQPYSHENIPCYERLEFLGDALLDMTAITHLFYKYPDKDEDWMSSQKSAMVSNKFLSALACKLGFHKYIRHNSSYMQADITAWVTELNEKIEAVGPESRDYWVDVSKPPKCLADVVEAYVGAMFIDSGFDYSQVQRFFDTHIRWHFEDIDLYADYASGHPMIRLQTLMHTTFGCRQYRMMNKEIPDVSTIEEKRVVVAVMLHNNIIAHSTGESARYASVRAAKAAVQLIEDMTVQQFRHTYGCDCPGNG